MSFNYGQEKRKFEKEWAKTATWYARAGMDKDSIEEIRRFDWNLFCKERTYSNHTQVLPNEIADESDERSVLFQKYEVLCNQNLEPFFQMLQYFRLNQQQ